jgi:hypothetical protein
MRRGRMRAGNSERELGCPHCGNTEDFYVEAYGSVEVRVYGQYRLEGVDDDGYPDDWYAFDEYDRDDAGEFELTETGDVVCGECGGHYSYLEPVDEDEDERPDRDERVRVTVDEASDVVGKLRATKDPLVQRSVAMKITKAAEMDEALGITARAGNFVQYLFGPDLAEEHGIHWTPEYRRLWDVGKELVAQGFYVGNEDLAQGDYTVRVYDIYEIPSDNLMNLDMGAPKAEASRRRVLWIQIYQDSPMGLLTRKHILLAVPVLPVDPMDGQVDWDDAVFIAELPSGENGGIALDDVERWTAEDFIKVEWYRCEREGLRQTLEVVFDFTPGGYIPWKPEARERSLFKDLSLAS